MQPASSRHGSPHHYHHHHHHQQQQQPPSSQPPSFECTDGKYVRCVNVAVPRPAMTGDELADLAPPPARMSFCSVTASPSSAVGQETEQHDRRHWHPKSSTETLFMSLSCRKLLYLCRDFSTVKDFSYDSSCTHGPMDHAFNLMTRSPESTEVACCFSSGALVILNVVTNHSRWINQGEEYTGEAATALAWLPGSESHLLVGHANGVVYLIDTNLNTASPIPTPRDSKHVYRLHKQPEADANPLRALARDKEVAVSHIACSNDCSSVAIAYMDGVMLVLDREAFGCRFVARSYYGGFTSVAWSADCKFIVTGGEDDLVSVWSVEDKDILARCVGHRSFVSAVAFDDHFADVERGMYRIGSVGQDGQLLLWNFSLDTLPPPVAARSAPAPLPAVSAPPTTRKEGMNYYRPRWMRGRKAPKDARSGNHQQAEVPYEIPVRPNREVSQVEPASAFLAHREPATDLTFRIEGVYTVDHLGWVALWLRPSKTEATAV